jgi:hypothetical protein
MKQKKKLKRPGSIGNKRSQKIGETEKLRIVELIKHGLTESQICEAFGFTARALQYVKAKDETFFHAIRESRKVSDSKVEKALYERALGYSHNEEKIFCTKRGKIVRAKTIKHYPPDVEACQFWLTNRKSENWKNKHDIDLGKGTVDAAFSIARLLSGGRSKEDARIAAGEDPGLVLFGRSNGCAPHGSIADGN